MKARAGVRTISTLYRPSDLTSASEDDVLHGFKHRADQEKKRSITAQGALSPVAKLNQASGAICSSSQPEVSGNNAYITVEAANGNNIR